VSHVYHEGLPGYHPESILHDGCPECEERSRRGLDGVLALTRDRQLALWRGAFGPYVRPSSSCDERLRRELTAVAVFLGGAGISPEEVAGRWKL
jgi:hypothetical protein